MNHIAGKKSSLDWVVHISTLLLVLLWLFPTLGLLISSFRSADQIASSGWWQSPFPQQHNLVIRTSKPNPQIVKKDQNGHYVITGNLFQLDHRKTSSISAWGTSSLKIAAYKPGETAKLRYDRTITVDRKGNFTLSSVKPITGLGQRVFITATLPPTFTLANYHRVLFSKDATVSMTKAFINTLTVTIPATIIPILIAAFAAYALAYMEFPGRVLLITLVIALLVVPLQLALIPLLRLHNEIGIGKGYLGTWLAHTGFGMPLAIYLLRNYMVGLPRDIIENARVDGATDFQIFRKIIIPLSFPALASFAIFQFLWVWNDLLVAKVFLIDASGKTTVMTNQIVELLGTKGGNWEILATAAFVSIAVPLLVFFAMQRYLVRGLLAGSVK